VVALPEHASHPDFIHRFETEAQFVAQLEHLHIVPLYDYWRDPQGAYLVMHLMKGGTLEQTLQRGPLSLPQMARWRERSSLYCPKFCANRPLRFLTEKELCDFRC